MEALKLEGLKPDIRNTLRPYLVKLLHTHKENISSIMLYGSAAGKDYIPKSSDINLLVIFNNLDFKGLRLSANLVKHGLEKNITAPLFLSADYINTSKDVFPLEFLEIKENHILLYGSDIFTDMKIDDKYMKISCEREVKGKLIRLRESYLETGPAVKALRALTKESIHSLMPAFKGLIRLKGKRPHSDREYIIKDVSFFYNLNQNILLTILLSIDKESIIKDKEAEMLFEKYLEELTKLSSAIDKL